MHQFERHWGNPRDGAPGSPVLVRPQRAARGPVGRIGCEHTCDRLGADGGHRRQLRPRPSCGSAEQVRTPHQNRMRTARILRADPRVELDRSLPTASGSGGCVPMRTPACKPRCSPSWPSASSIARWCTTCRTAARRLRRLAPVRSSQPWSPQLQLRSSRVRKSSASCLPRSPTP